MIPPTHEPQPGTREHFLQVTILRRWGTIQDYVDPCREPGYFTLACYATAIAHLGIMCPYSNVTKDLGAFKGHGSVSRY
jgi:hypothetical protein